MSEPKSENAALFWQLHGLPRWEQIAFAAINMPFSLITLLLGFVLLIPFRVMILLRYPFLLFALVGSVIWTICLGVILALSWLTERAAVLRPLTFLLALPFLILAHNLNGLTPAPTLGDMEAKVGKWDLVEAFPFTWSLLRFRSL